MKETLIIAFGTFLTLLVFSSFIWLPAVIDILRERVANKRWEKILATDPTLKDLVSNYIKLRDARHTLLKDLRGFRDSIDALAYELDYLPASVREQRLDLLEVYRNHFHKTQTEIDQLLLPFDRAKRQLQTYAKDRKIQIPTNFWENI